MPDEEIEQEPADHDDADGDGEQSGAGLERQPRHRVDGAHAEQEAEQRGR